MWEAAWIALPVLMIILIGFFTNLRIPGNIPVGLAALLGGTAIGWTGGYMSVPDVAAAAADIAIALPTFHIAQLISEISNVAPLLATAIPLGIYNFTEGMTNVESAAAAGDNYNLRSVLLADGTGAVVGAALGSPFPPAVYIGHPGRKEAGGRTSYSMLSGVVIALLCFLGMFGLLGALLPMPAIVPILLYIGLLIGAQAFQAVPRAHAVAVVIAIIPNIASWAQGQMANVLVAAGTTPEQVGEAKSLNAGVIYRGTEILGGGAILAGLVLGATVAFIIDRAFLGAALYCLVGAALSFVGLTHAAQVGWNAAGQVSLGYLFAGIVCLIFVVINRSWSLTMPAADRSDGGEPAEKGSGVEEPGAVEPAAEQSGPGQPLAGRRT
jgi:adenine/guanine/hypoxanthine permease